LPTTINLYHCQPEILLFTAITTLRLPPRGRGVRDPETKSVGNSLKRVVPQTKLVYGDGKCPKNTKNNKASNLPMWPQRT